MARQASLPQSFSSGDESRVRSNVRAVAARASSPPDRWRISLARRSIIEVGLSMNGRAPIDSGTTDLVSGLEASRYTTVNISAIEKLTKIRDTSNFRRTSKVPLWVEIRVSTTDLVLVRPENMDPSLLPPRYTSLCSVNDVINDHRICTRPRCRRCPLAYEVLASATVCSSRGPSCNLEYLKGLDHQPRNSTAYQI